MPGKNLVELVNVSCPLDKALLQLVPGSVRFADQITNERRENEPLRGEWLITQDFPMYEQEDGDVEFYLSRVNLVFENLEDACRHIGETNNYICKPSDAKRVKKSRTTIKMPLSELRLIEDTHEWCHIAINPDKDESQFNDSERPLIERAYGSMKAEKGKESDFIQNMQMLNTAGLKNTNFYVLNPTYVIKNAPEGKAIARVCKLSNFNYDSDFNAYNRNIDGSYVILRGEPISAGGATKQKNVLSPVSRS